MTTRIETFQNLATDPGDRAYVAILDAIQTLENGKRKVVSCINFFGKTEEEAIGRLADFLKEQEQKEALAAEYVRKRAEARKSA